MEQKKKHNLLRFCIFALICLILAAPALACGELLHVSGVVALQPYLGDDFIYGASYSGSYSLYKYTMLTQRKAPVLAVGDSRVLQFKSAFFSNEEDFYNAGMLFVSAHSCLISLQNIPEDALPKVLIYGIDQSSLTRQESQNSKNDRPAFMDSEQYATPRDLLKAMSIDVGKGKYKLWQLFGNISHIGVTAKTQQSGFMQDGSYYYGAIYNGSETAKTRVGKDVDRIKKGQDWFAGSDGIDAYSLEVFAQIADFCNEKGIKLIAFMPPFSQTGYEAYHSRKDTKFLDDIDAQVAPVFTSRGAEFYNFTSPDTLGLTDDEFIDAFHGSDVAYLKIMQRLVSENSAVSEYVNTDTLNTLYANRVSGLVLKEGL